MSDVSSPVAIVTGASRGIGAAIARHLTAQRYRVVSFDLEEPDMSAAETFIVDVSKSGEADAAVRTVMTTHGRIDVVVNNAGILDVHAAHDTPDEIWDRVMAVNVKSVYLMARATVPHLRAAPNPSIVNICSVHAVATVPRAAAYAASKGAVLALTRQMALDYADDGIRVNAILAGSVDTAMSRGHAAAAARDNIKLSPAVGTAGRQGEPSEIAQVVGFLVSPEASFVTGSPLIVDGGLLARLM